MNKLLIENNAKRRYDVDWLRVLALGLLIVYHAVVAFQSWGHKIFFIQNKEFLELLWLPMSMFNIWRIPILFMISGMGVYFAMRRRNWKQLLKDRTLRILLPFVFGFFFICPINIYIASIFYGKDLFYIPNPGHLWFLGNIFIYVLAMLPMLIYLNNRPDNFIFRYLSRIFRFPLGVVFLALLPMTESFLVRPEYFTTYAMTPHGFWLGLICFFIGFCIVSLGGVFWDAVEKARLFMLSTAFLLFLVRLVIFLKTQVEGRHALTGFESMCWMLAVLGYGSMYLNKPSHTLFYCKEAVYPIYIVHMPLQLFFSLYIIPLSIPAIIKLALLLASTFGGSLIIYEVLRRLKWLRPLFGMKPVTVSE